MFDFFDSRIKRVAHYLFKYSVDALENMFKEDFNILNSRYA